MRMAAALAVVALGAAARPAGAAEWVALPGEPPALGTSWDAHRALPLGGSCVRGSGSHEEPGRSPRYSLVLLTRAGGRLVLGLHVAATRAIETIQAPQLGDAPRRLLQSDPKAFGELCGDGFVAAIARGGQYAAEIEFDPADARRVAAWLEIHAALGSWSEPDPFREAVEGLLGRYGKGLRVRELPGGSRRGAVEIEPAQALARALALPASVGEADGQPYAAAFQPYTAGAAAGLEIQVTVPGAEGLAAALLAGGGVGRGFTGRVLGGAQPPTPRTAPGAGSVQAAELAPALRSSTWSGEAFSVAPGVVVYATERAPIGVLARPAGGREIWVPGVAVATSEVEGWLDEATASDGPGRPVQGVVVLVGEVVVHLTPDPPVPGVHAERAGSLYAWIPGIASPGPNDRQALEAAVRAEAEDH
jgi:hypothetical protein